MTRSKPIRRKRHRGEAEIPARQGSKIDNRRWPRVRRALTIIELLVVISIIAVLISVISVASSTLIGKSRASNSRGLLEVVSTAIQQFKAERPAVLKQNYLKRYGPYPPDELEVFVAGAANPVATNSIAPGGATIEPPPPYQAMKFFAADATQAAMEHRDLAAMIIAIETLTQEAASILDKVPDRNRAPGPLDTSNPPRPTQFLDRTPAGWDENDLQVRYIVDDWGVPLGYLAQRDWVKSSAPPSPNHPDWNEASTKMIRLNGGDPVIFSWGPDGKDQLTQDAMSDADNPAALVADFKKDGKIDHPMNGDNIYLDATFAEKLSGQAEQ